MNYNFLLRNQEMLDDPAWHRGLPEPIIADVRASLASLPTRLASPSALVATDQALYRRKFEQLSDNGVELLIGTDTGNPGHFHTFGLWVELDVWVNHFGVEATDAIRRATSLAAEVMGVAADYGTVERGKYADIIVVRGDPLRHIDVLREPVVVIKHGKRVK
jgi:imidazolonepropionase-like amidohydrolase